MRRFRKKNPIVVFVVVLLLFSWGACNNRFTTENSIVSMVKFGYNVLYLTYLYMNIDMHTFDATPHWWDAYAWHGPTQAYCEARFSREVGQRKDFTYTHWQVKEQQLAERWFPIGTPLDDAFNHFANEQFAFVFKGYEELKETKGVRLDPSERYVRFETWSTKDDVPYLQTLIYFVFNKSDPKWRIKRTRVVHNVRKKNPMLDLLQECEMEEVNGDRDLFDWKNDGHFSTEGRRMGLVSEIKDLRDTDVYEKLVWSLWEQWFPKSAPFAEVDKYLLGQGFRRPSKASCCVKDGDNFFRYSLKGLRLKIGLSAGADEESVKTGYLWDVHFYGNLRYINDKERPKARQAVLARIAKREGRDLYE